MSWTAARNARPEAASRPSRWAIPNQSSGERPASALIHVCTMKRVTLQSERGSSNASRRSRLARQDSGT